ncbi:type I phosphodiesterase / nucleotide pyrophosphatase family protein [Mycobacterium kansasii]|uniref:Type I phosphodiesterase / nucleotide pyrophosphatase family protein n=1 Tax=Mycobacterium kansasii TaxID=1768 RepID=A0A1V3XRE1_MYCKA|nr:type I phosphodiesterase / nucleotide pyrophosphatase family protein [Mycobacterium kansasii]
MLPEWFLGSGLTAAAYRGAQLLPTRHGQDYAGQIAVELAAAPGLVYGYTAELDTAAHLFGIGSEQWHAAAGNVDNLLTHLAEALPTNAALLVTADHGGLNVPAGARLDLDADPRLTAGIRVVAGEPRVRYLHTQPGATADVLATWRELLTCRADVHSRQEAVATGLFGPVTRGTCRGSATSWSSAAAKRPSWPPATSLRKRPAHRFSRCGHGRRDGNPADRLRGLTPCRQSFAKLSCELIASGRRL